MRRTVQGGNDVLYLLNDRAQSLVVPSPTGSWHELLAEKPIMSTVEIEACSVAILRAVTCSSIFEEDCGTIECTCRR
jgi:hypothetical protein